MIIPFKDIQSQVAQCKVTHTDPHHWITTTMDHVCQVFLHALILVTLISLSPQLSQQELQRTMINRMTVWVSFQLDMYYFLLWLIILYIN
ncbi:unnamed protein product [Mycena citricolor]|uniref:Uncharacterized protein n=1 Tax=Mycena citricolor TaxID=2018698 RepID=A0AAD2HLE2_9AGAR|nr:unnamed protein product [Mycena citricolor]